MPTGRCDAPRVMINEALELMVCVVHYYSPNNLCTYSQRMLLQLCVSVCGGGAGTCTCACMSSSTARYGMMHKPQGSLGVELEGESTLLNTQFVNGILLQHVNKN